MACAPVLPTVREACQQLAEEVQQSHRGLIRELRIALKAAGAELDGQATCYYGKQIAQEEVRRRGLRVVANRNRVAQAVDHRASRI